ncbi:MAG: hypothetical protein ACRC2T_12265 [Thermoguttaceae bacterium]
MSAIMSIIKIPIDPANPGQYFACCGLLELAHRHWGTDAKGCFTDGGNSFTLEYPENLTDEKLKERLIDRIQIPRHEESIKEDIRNEQVKKDKNKLKRKNKTNLDSKPILEETIDVSGDNLSDEDDEKYSPPFSLVWKDKNEKDHDIFLDWWFISCKTWAGQQYSFKKIGTLNVQSKRVESFTKGFQHSITLNQNKETGETSPPCQIDIRTSWTPLDVGFSLDTQNKNYKRAIFPLVELLAVIGLQRFLPVPDKHVQYTYSYSLWLKPLDAVGASVSDLTMSSQDKINYTFSTPLNGKCKYFTRAILKQN